MNTTNRPTERASGGNSPLGPLNDEEEEEKKENKNDHFAPKQSSECEPSFSMSPSIRTN